MSEATKEQFYGKNPAMQAEIYEVFADWLFSTENVLFVKDMKKHLPAGVEIVFVNTVGGTTLFTITFEDDSVGVMSVNENDVGYDFHAEMK